MNSVSLFTMFVVFLGCFTQSLSGFGVALVTMAVLPSILGLRVATPLVALVGITLETMMVIRYYASFKIRSVLGLLISSLLATPLGVIYFRRVDEGVALFVLGLIIAVYAVYALIGFRLPVLDHPAWAWIFGFVGGLLGGAYNTSGPPAVIYGNCRRWTPEEFKSGLSGYFIFGSAVVVSTHWVSGNFKPDVISNYLVVLPALLFGFFLGQKLDRWLNPEVFRRIVLVMLVVLGFRLMM